MSHTLVIFEVGARARHVRRRRGRHEKRRHRRRRHDALRRALRARHQGPVADGVRRMRGQRRQGHAQDGSSSGLVRRNGHHRRIPVRNPRRHTGSARPARHPRGELLRDRQRRGPQRAVRCRIRRLRRRARDGRRQDPRDVDQGHGVGVGGHGPRHGLGLPARVGVARRIRAARGALPARVAGDHRAHGDGGGEEPPARGQRTRRRGCGSRSRWSRR